MACTNGGLSGSASVLVTVTSLPVAPATIKVISNRSTTWTLAPGGATGSGMSGTHTVAAGSAGTGYTLAPGSLAGYTVAVSNTDGSGSSLVLFPGQTKEFMMTYTPVPGPTAALIATPSVIVLGQSSTLSWSSTNATSCSASWTSAALPTSGSQLVQPTQNTSYSVSCASQTQSATATATVSVTQPSPVAPTITSVNPNPVTGSNSSQPFTINGSNFAAGATVTLRDLRTGEVFPNRPISSLTSTKIVINPIFTTTAANWTVQVLNSGGAASAQFSFQVVAPVAPVPPAPAISSVSPNPVTGANSPQPFTINGSNFAAGATVTLRDLRTGEVFPNRPISSLTSTKIVINPTFTTMVATWTVQVINPDGKASSQYSFQVVAPVAPGPAISSVSPNPVTGSNSSQPFTINGSNFVAGATVTLRDLRTGEVFPNRPISSLTSTKIVINPNFTTIAATWTVQVINPDGKASSQYSFQVVKP